MSKTDHLIDETNNTMTSLTNTIYNAKHATEETVKINTHVRLLIEATDGLVNESNTSKEVADKLAQIIKELENVANELNNESSKFRV